MHQDAGHPVLSVPGRQEHPAGEWRPEEEMDLERGVVARGARAGWNTTSSI